VRYPFIVFATPMPPTVTLLTDYGLQDEYVGVCHGVIARIAPEARVIDLTHGVPRHAIRACALALRRALPFTPPGVHVAVVDPGVGGPRRGIALRCGDRLLVGPDNGLLIPAAEHLGGVEEAVDLASSPWLLDPVSATFHGRDVFAPVAAHLALGEPLARAGEPLAPERLVAPALPEPRREGVALVAHALAFDIYGNVLLDASGGDLPPGERVEVAGRRVARGRTFGDVPDGELLLYEDSSGALALAVNGGSARDELGLRLDDEVRIA
jgi:S-adenosyl-L-methionine hydrolase (adenosine-forming)